jgi:hypothetical protein
VFRGVRRTGSAERNNDASRTRHSRRCESEAGCGTGRNGTHPSPPVPPKRAWYAVPMFFPASNDQVRKRVSPMVRQERAADVQEMVNILSALSSRRLRGRRRSLNANVLVADLSGRALVLASARERLGGETKQEFEVTFVAAVTARGQGEHDPQDSASYSRPACSSHASLSLSVPLRDLEKLASRRSAARGGSKADRSPVREAGGNRPQRDSPSVSPVPRKRHGRGLHASPAF